MPNHACCASPRAFFGNSVHGPTVNPYSVWRRPLPAGSPYVSLTAGGSSGGAAAAVATGAGCVQCARACVASLSLHCSCLRGQPLADGSCIDCLSCAFSCPPLWPSGADVHTGCSESAPTRAAASDSRRPSVALWASNQATVCIHRRSNAGALDLATVVVPE